MFISHNVLRTPYYSNTSMFKLVLVVHVSTMHSSIFWHELSCGCSCVGVCGQGVRVRLTRLKPTLFVIVVWVLSYVVEGAACLCECGTL